MDAAGPYHDQPEPAKLQTIWSVPTQDAGANSSVEFTRSRPGLQNTVETAAMGTTQLDEHRELAKSMELQVATMNQAISQLRQDHEKQISAMQEFYNNQISIIRQEYSQLSSKDRTSSSGAQMQQVEQVPPQVSAAELLSKLMN